MSDSLSKKKELQEKELKKNLESMKISLRVLDFSYTKCRKIGIKAVYTDEELESFESLTARFARTADILTQKILITLFILMKEDARSFIDRANLAEKLEIIDSSEDLLNIRELRNEIAHEYAMRDIIEIFNEVLNNTDSLKTIIESTIVYINDKFPGLA